MATSIINYFQDKLDTSQKHSFEKLRKNEINETKRLEKCENRLENVSKELGTCQLKQQEAEIYGEACLNAYQGTVRGARNFLEAQLPNMDPQTKKLIDGVLPPAVNFITDGNNKKN